MGPVGPRPVVLDAGALIAYERADRRVVRLLELAEEVCVPAGVVGQVWRNPARQARLARLLSSREVDIAPLDFGIAKAAGHLCGATGTSDVIDATVVLAARPIGAVVVTSDPQDVSQLDPSLAVVTC
ncbi:MAG: PIN domain-containing protein [Acidimicrobiales bacterium]